MKTRKSSQIAADDYLELVKAFPLKVIRTDQEQEDAVRVLSRLVGREQANLSEGTRQYTDALARLIQDYDQREYPLIAVMRSPLEKLKYLLEESGTTSAGLARILGASQPLVSLILAGKRNLTVPHMRKLSEHFKIAAGYFL